MSSTSDVQNQALVDHLVTQTKLALTDLSWRSRSLSNAPILKKATLNIDTKFVRTNSGSGALLVSAGGENSRTTSDSIKLVLSAPSKASITALDSTGPMMADRSEISSALTEIVSSKQSAEVDCSPTISNDQEERPFWKDLSGMTSAAVAGYLCANKNSDLQAVLLQELVVKVSFSVTGKSEFGLEFEVKGVGLGGTRSSETTNGNSIELSFGNP